MDLTAVWFGFIAFLWVGYLVLEGFDFGVGILMPLLGRDEAERDTVLETIGPVWDGNEVWLIVAGGAMFAAFPEWYATMFSGFYLPLFVILVSLILRAVALEYRGKHDDPRWRRRWEHCICYGSLVPAVLWGVALANIVRGVPIDGDHEYAGTVLDLLNPYALLGGLTTLALFLTHGALFVALKTDGDLRARANRLGRRTGVASVLVAGAFLGWTVAGDSALPVVLLGAGAALSLVAGLLAAARGRDGWAFTGTTLTVGLAVTLLFVSLYPDVMPSTLDAAWSLTKDNAASTPYTLKIMTFAAVFFMPLVMLYQGWSYWVFRKRLTVRRSAETGGY